MDGTLRIALIGGFQPQVGQEFAILICGQRTGEFAARTGSILGPKSLVPIYEAGGLTLLACWSGDADFSGQVDYVDLGVFATHYGAAGAGWGQGDFTGDRLVDYVDLGILATYYDGGTKPPAAVPEPTAIALLALAGAAVLRRRR